MRNIKIDNKTLTETSRSFIVAEVGVNYYDIADKEGISPFEAAKLMIEEATKAGADAVKFQTYKAEKLASKYSPAYWDASVEPTRSQYELFKKFDKFGEEEFNKLAKHCKKNKICFLSTPFDFESVDYLDKIMPVYKIASADITNIPFIKYIAQKNKPIFLSTGASTIEEIKEAVKTITEEGNTQIVIMHCILNYPTKYDDANLGMIRYLKNSFPDYLIGYSDHTFPDENMMVLLTAFLLGATVIEKHFTLDKTIHGNDHFHAMDPQDLIKFNENMDIIMKISGEEKKKVIEAEKTSRKFARRSIVAINDIPEGNIITKNMITFKRPGTGISPKCYEQVLGMKAKRDIKNDEILSWDDLC